MIGYVTLGTNDVPRAAKFYDELLAVIGAGRVMEDDNFVAWATAADKPALSVITPYDGNPATVGNGTSVERARRFGQEIAAELVNEGVQAVIFTST